MIEPLDRRIKAWITEVYGKSGVTSGVVVDDAAASALLAVVGIHEVRFTGTAEHGFVSCLECGGERDDPPYCRTLEAIAASLGRGLDPAAASPPGAETDGD